MLFESKSNVLKSRKYTRSLDRMFILDDLSRLYLEKLVFDLRCNTFRNYIQEEKSGVGLC